MQLLQREPGETMLRSIATVSISGTLPEKLSAIAAAGYQGVEIFENDLLYYTGTPADVRNMADDLGPPAEWASCRSHSVRPSAGG